MREILINTALFEFIDILDMMDRLVPPVDS